MSVAEIKAKVRARYGHMQKDLKKMENFIQHVHTSIFVVDNFAIRSFLFSILSAHFLIFAAD